MESLIEILITAIPGFGATPFPFMYYVTTSIVVFGMLILIAHVKEQEERYGE